MFSIQSFDTLPRTHRIEFSEAIYHVVNRGNYRSHIFESDGAKGAFVKALDEACERFGWRLHAYCVMSNHFHLCLSTPKGNLSAGMGWLQGTFAQRFNRYRKEVGHLFQGRFKSLIVEPGNPLLDLVDYIHLNPARAGLATVAGIRRYPWTSLFRFPKIRTRETSLDPFWMAFGDGLSDSRGGWIRYCQRLAIKETLDPKELERLEKRLCRGWCIGDREYREAVASDLMSREGQVVLEKEGLAEMNRLQWDLLLKKCLARLGKTGGDALSDNFSARWKRSIASEMKRRTSVTNLWLAEKLNMGAPNSVSNLCGVYNRSVRANCPYSRKLRNL